ncbi:hypothetical protein J1N35_007581 [Gossypium stocksii]|uniref:RNase H type-1 domain-containing protein n=1 Tax=Gossypium stocksii TaxID=47602 RepID=A0A9D3W7R6_9ROSI|nr:hypothetical protein J1N35_007581 [Gossypium stocksii]
MRLLDKKVVVDFITTLWNSWNNRNNYVFRGKEEEARVIWDRAITLCKDFWIHNMVNKPVLPLAPSLYKWEKPLSGTVKINFDAIVSNNKTRFGVIVRDSDCFVIGEDYGFKDEKMMVNWVELYVFEECLNTARFLNIANAIFEIDCASLANRIKKQKEDITIIVHCINESFKTMEMLNNVFVNWVNRSCNKVVDFM